MDEDDQDEACQDKRIRERWNVHLLQNAKEMDMSPYSPSPSPKQCGSFTKNSAQRKQSKSRREKTGRSISCNMGSVEKLIKEEAKDACVRPHSGIRLSAINKVDNNSTEEDNDSKRNETDNETRNSNKDTSIGGSGFSMPSPNNNCSSIDSAIGGALLIDS